MRGFLGRSAAVERSWVFVPVLAFACGCGSPTGPEPEDLGILFIGNSLTYVNDLPGMVEALFDMGGAGEIFVASQTQPNYGLPDHWVAGARDRIADSPWDVVVLQQGPSATEGRPYLLEYSRLFAEDIRAVGGTPALYMVWPSMSRFFDFDGVSDSYQTAAVEANGLLFPAGEAWRIAWEADPSLELYGSDGFHPSPLGTYLAALVIYQQLSGLDPTDLPPRIESGAGSLDLDPDVALLLQGAAAEANARFARSVGGL
ncbi:MAG: SGNH/GDSL hydrolase family protein [Gemmatimonadota bacterium]